LNSNPQTTTEEQQKLADEILGVQAERAAVPEKLYLTSKDTAALGMLRDLGKQLLRTESSRAENKSVQEKERIRKREADRETLRVLDKNAKKRRHSSRAVSDDDDDDDDSVSDGDVGDTAHGTPAPRRRSSSSSSASLSQSHSAASSSRDASHHRVSGGDGNFGAVSSVQAYLNRRTQTLHSSTRGADGEGLGKSELGDRVGALEVAMQRMHNDNSRLFGMLEQFLQQHQRAV
jgi:hypothetical protein